MSDLEVIQQTVARASRRRRWMRVWRGAWTGLLLGGLAWLLVLVAYKLFPLPATWPGIAGLAIPVGLLGGFFWAWSRPAGLQETAQWLDRRVGLKDRLSTAMELSARPQADDWNRLVARDAAEHAGQVDPRRLLPFQLPEFCRWTVVILALAAGLGFVPEYRSEEYQKEQEDAALVRDTGAHLTRIAERKLETRPPADATVKESVSEVGDLGRKFQGKRLTRDAALKDLANLTDKLKQDLNKLGQDPVLKRMQQAARSGNTGEAETREALQKRLDALKQAVGDKAGDPEKLESMKKELDELAQQAQALNEPGSPAAQQALNQMGESLSDLARKAEAMGMDISGLDEAIAALQQQDIDQFVKGLENAMNDLEGARELAEALKQAQSKMAQLGKDLGEQLERGQADAAKQSLAKMIDQLREGTPTSEEMQDMMQEVAEAIQPGSRYGQVGQHLDEALREMQEGNNEAAAQSLAQAAEELERLKQQMADCESLREALDALQQAQMCLGNGSQWGQCLKPGMGQGGKPGMGVGTWAQETGWIREMEQTQGWDNSNFNRPDQDPRGLTDRGEGEVPEGLTGTRVKGQFSPGADMPSITLKGVSIRGTSKVQFEEMVKAAQTEAETALSQQQVPRNHQSTVRDYFNDLKD